MKARLLALAALMLAGVSAYAQEDVDPPFSPYFAVEIGTGLAPIHTWLNSSWALGGISDDGQRAVNYDSFCPAFSLSVAWHPSLKWEVVLTGGYSWVHHRMIQYESFGIDPKGQPRFDLSSHHDAGWKDSLHAGAIFIQVRRFWNPTQKVKLYSAAGFGYAFDPTKEFGLVPSITPIAVRFGTGHLKFFIENTFSPVATAFDLGLGWAF